MSQGAQRDACEFFAAQLKLLTFSCLHSKAPNRNRAILINTEGFAGVPENSRFENVLRSWTHRGSFGFLRGEVFLQLNKAWFYSQADFPGWFGQEAWWTTYGWETVRPKVDRVRRFLVLLVLGHHLAN